MNENLLDDIVKILKKIPNSQSCTSLMNNPHSKFLIYFLKDLVSSKYLELHDKITEGIDTTNYQIKSKIYPELASSISRISEDLVKKHKNCKSFIRKLLIKAKYRHNTDLKN